jgi:hypothetical protein
MTRTDPDSAAAFDAALDRIVAGDAPGPDADRDDTIAAARRLHARHGAHARTPDPRFVTDLEDRLMSTAHALPPTSLTGAPIAAGRPAPQLLARTRASFSRGLSAAAVVLLLAGASYAAIDNRPEGTPGPAGTAAALLAPESGTPVATDGEAMPPQLLWEQATPGFDPAGFGGMVWHADAIYRLHTVDGVAAVEAVDAATGARRWQTAALVVPGGGLVVDDAGVVVAADAVTLVSLNLATGAEQWRVALDEPIAAITAGDGHVGVTSLTGRVSVLDATTGAVVWTNATGAAPAIAGPALGGGQAVIVAADGTVVAWDLATAAPVWTIAGVDPGATQVQVGAAGVLVATADSAGGIVVATWYDPAAGAVISQTTVPGALVPVGIAGGPVMVSQEVVGADASGVASGSGVVVGSAGIVECGTVAGGAGMVVGSSGASGGAVIAGTVEAGAVAVGGGGSADASGVAELMPLCGETASGSGTIAGAVVGSGSGVMTVGVAGGSGVVTFGGDTMLIDGTPVVMDATVVTIDANTGEIITEGNAMAIPGDILALTANPADPTLVVVTRLDGTLAAYRLQ